MTLIRGGPAGPDASGGSFANEVEADRAALWDALGGRQGVIRGFTHATVAGQMALDFAAGAALVGERAGDGTASLPRGYHVWADATTRVQLDPASPAVRNDAVVAAFVDVEDGPMGAAVSDVGPQLVAVKGVSGTATPRTDTQINTALGRGGWVRLVDVTIAPGDTQVSAANVAVNAAARLDPGWVQLITAGSGFIWDTFLAYRKVGPVVHWSGVVSNRTGSTITMGAAGNITDVTIANPGAVPAELRPQGGANGQYMEAILPGVATFWWRINADGSISLTHGLPNASWAHNTTIRIQGYSVPDYGV